MCPVTTGCSRRPAGRPASEPASSATRRSVDEGVKHLWTTADLTAALLHGTRLPGEPDGPPPWPHYLDRTYRRQTAAQILGERVVHSVDCLGPLLYVAARDEDEDVRLRCLERVFASGWVGLEGFLVAMTFDAMDCVRQLALEGLALSECQSLHTAADRLVNDPDPDIREQAAGMLAGDSWPRWRL